MGLAAVLYRAGRYDEAQAQLSEAEQTPATSATSPAFLSYFQAMTNQQLGQAKEAKSWIERATEESRKELDNAAEPPSWQRRLTLQSLGDEARQLINPRNTDD